MAYDKQKVIDIALAEVDYLEKASIANLDDKTANAGRKNYTKYARDLDSISFFNGRKQGFAWCAVWVCWNFVQAYGVEAAKELLCLPPKAANNCAAGCGYAYDYFKRKGQLYDSPESGDQIFFWSSDKKTKSHTGLVYKVDSKKVYTIEGNTSSSSGVVANGGGVFKKSYSLNYGRIAGYGRPKYGTKTPVESFENKGDKIPSEQNKTQNNKEIGGNTIMVELNTQRNGNRGNQVKTIQRLLNEMGHSCGKVDGIFGSKTLAAVKAFQKAKGLSVDGVVGKDTWNALLK